MIPRPVSESSWPVGSSASSSVGPVGERAGDRHALLLAAGQLVRPVLGAVAEPDQLEQLADPLARARAARRVTSRSGTSTFSAADRIGSRPNVWKTKPIVAPPELDQLVLVASPRPLPVDDDLARGRPVEAADAG